MNPFTAPGEWLRCQLHCHTDQSDGEPTIAELIAHYEAAGCDVLAITDHWLITRGESSTMLMLPASELSSKLDRAPFEAEVLALGIEELPEPREEFDSIAACAQWIVDHGGVAYLAHPRWSSLTADDYLSAPALSGLEIYNGGCEVEQPQHDQVARPRRRRLRPGGGVRGRGRADDRGLEQRLGSVAV